LRVHTAGEYHAVVFHELVGVVVEAEDFSGADKGEVQRVKEEDDVLAAVLLEGNLSESPFVPSSGGEARGRLADSCLRRVAEGPRHIFTNRGAN